MHDMMSSGGAASESFEQQHAKRRPPVGPPPQQQRKLLTLSLQDNDDGVAAGVVSPVTMVLDGRCICHRVHLNRHTGYRSFAGTLRRMFVDAEKADLRQKQRGEDNDPDLDLDLANAVPGHVVAYEDMEDDLQ